MYIKEFRLTRLLTWYLFSTVCCPIRPVTSSLPLPTDWETLCPYTDFCTHKAAHPINLTRAQKPCCEPCSCEPECGLRRNCCQYSMDRYRIDEKYYTTCTSLSTAVDTFGDLQPRRFYMTVDKCPNKTSCYNFKAARWGSMFPVSSLETNMIYLNKQCAICHNDQNVTEWETEINCGATDARRFFHVDGLTNALNGNPIEPAMCSLTFFPPKEADIDFQSCINNVNMLRTCMRDTNTTYFIQLSPLCKSFNATFFNKRKGFANIYCFLCSSPDGPSRKDDICAVEHTIRTENTPFSALIAPGVIQALGRIHVAKYSGTGTEGFAGCLPNEVGERKTVSRKIKVLNPPGDTTYKIQSKINSIMTKRQLRLWYIKIQKNTRGF